MFTYISLLSIIMSVMVYLYIRCCAVCTSALASYSYGVLIPSLPALLLLCRIRILASYGGLYPIDSSRGYAVLTSPELLTYLCRLSIRTLPAYSYAYVAFVFNCHTVAVCLYFSLPTVPRVLPRGVKDKTG
jgi:hypothetical protein